MVGFTPLLPKSKFNKYLAAFSSFPSLLGLSSCRTFRWSQFSLILFSPMSPWQDCHGLCSLLSNYTTCTNSFRNQPLLNRELEVIARFRLDLLYLEATAKSDTKRATFQLGSYPQISLDTNLGQCLLTFLNIITQVFKPRWSFVQRSPLSSMQLLPCDPSMRRAVSYDLS